MTFLPAESNWKNNTVFVATIASFNPATLELKP